MKNVILLFSFLLLTLSFGLKAQTTQASFAGVWKMNPTNFSHKLSKLRIIDNGATMTIKLKKSPVNNYAAKYDPSDRKLHVTIDNVAYFFVYVPANNSIMGYVTNTNTKFSDYIK